MRISRRRHKPEEPKKTFFFNEGIHAPQVLVLNSSGASVGVMNTGEAIRLAREQEMDLVEINPKTEPPVAKIMNFGQYQYQQEKAARIRKAHQHVTKIKNVRMSLRIGANDRDIRKKQALEFLDGGDKVKIDIVLRGREMQQGALAFDAIKKFIAEITETVTIKYDQDVERQGNLITATIFKS
ncbi:MAG: translation initiation factor IF-3 [Patescibacteria group bacterium]|nr:translation initiation factor IF-3 [Patescibacteria group bacterium]